MNKDIEYNNMFEELKQEVKEAGLLNRVPIRGTIEMISVILSVVLVLVFSPQINPIIIGLLFTIIFTRSVFVSHDILHRQYFKDKSISKKLSYPFSAMILSNSSSWWDYKHNVNHHTYCNIVEKDEDIRALDGAFTPQRGNSPFIKKYKHIIFWGSMFFMFPAFIGQSYSFVVKRKLWGELFFMLSHWFVIWGVLLSQIGLGNTLIVAVTLNFILSPWLAFGFITNHLGCETFTEKEAKDFSWLELQMRGSRSLKGGFLVHWFYGGLNTQIEHHIFPKAPRFNLLKVQKITKDFAKKYNINYFETTPIEAYIQINNALKLY